MPLAIALDLGLGGQRIHERLNGVTGIALFIETDSRVNEQEEDNTNEIFPVRSATLAVGECDSDQGGSLHNPGEGVPHETKELVTKFIQDPGAAQMTSMRVYATYLKEGVLLFTLKLVGTKQLKTTLCLCIV